MSSRQPTETDLRQAREAMQIALGNAEQPAFVSKIRARWQDTRRRYEAADDRLDRSANHEDRKLGGDLRTFHQERDNHGTVLDRTVRDPEGRGIEAALTQRTKGWKEGGEGQDVASAY